MDCAAAPPSRPVEKLTNGLESETLAFLSARPVHTFVMSSLINDNGLESGLNRGDFFGCRDAAGHLAGVALFGHATLFEARDGGVVDAFARFGRTLPAPHMIMGEREKTVQFWSSYSAPGDPTPHGVDALLYEQSLPVDLSESAPTLRAASLEDVELVAQVHARMAFDESGVNPLEGDPEGFRRRVAQRIEKGRVRVCVKRGRLHFKADLVSETPDVVYLEGVYVDPGERGKGYGLRCLTSLCRDLLDSTKSVVILVNAENQTARRLYERAGFTLRSQYHMIYPGKNAARA